VWACSLKAPTMPSSCDSKNMICCQYGSDLCLLYCVSIQARFCSTNIYSACGTLGTLVFTAKSICQTFWKWFQISFQVNAASRYPAANDWSTPLSDSLLLTDITDVPVVADPVTNEPHADTPLGGRPSTSFKPLGEAGSCTTLCRGMGDGKGKGWYIPRVGLVARPKHGTTSSKDAINYFKSDLQQPCFDSALI